MREAHVSSLYEASGWKDAREEAVIVTRNDEPVALLISFADLPADQREALGDLLDRNAFAGTVTALCHAEPDVALPPDVRSDLCS